MGERPADMFMFAGTNFCVQLAPTDRGASDPPGERCSAPTRWTRWLGISVLTPEGAVDRSLVGTSIVRRVALDGDLAMFTTPSTLVDGVDATTVITWRRVSG